MQQTGYTGSPKKINNNKSQHKATQYTFTHVLLSYVSPSADRMSKNEFPLLRLLCLCVQGRKSNRLTICWQPDQKTDTLSHRRARAQPHKHMHGRAASHCLAAAARKQEFADVRGQFGRALADNSLVAFGGIVGALLLPPDSGRRWCAAVWFGLQSIPMQYAMRSI